MRNASINMNQKIRRMDILLKVGLVFFLPLLAITVFGPTLAPYPSTQIEPNNILAPPGARHWIGTDRMGRDVMSRVLCSFRTSVSIGFFSIILASLIGIPLGVSGAFIGGLFNVIVQRLVDILLSFPSLIMGILIVLAIGAGYLGVILAIGLRYTANLARLARSLTLEEKEVAYIEAACSYGAGQGRIIFRHIIPNIFGVLIVHMGVLVGIAMLIESGLAFVGLGVQPPTPSWGNMIRDGISVFRVAPWITVFPGLALTSSVLILSIVGDGLRNQLDPRRRGIRK